jgi:hypothetical protein
VYIPGKQAPHPPDISRRRLGEKYKSMAKKGTSRKHKKEMGSKS